MYDVKSMEANEFIDHGEVLESIEQGKKLVRDKDEVDRILEKVSQYKGLTHREAAVLLEIDDDDTLEKMYKVAREIKEEIYGKRIVLFAPLYLSSYCVNNCKYCGYKCTNKIKRHKLTQEELKAEVRALEAMGHKRLLLEAGEDDKNSPIEYILECINTIYNEKFENGDIRRVNIDIAATTVENYRKLKDADVGTYTLFQETYHKPTYLDMHHGPKGNYEWHTEAMDRAMEAGIEDVGIGPLYGLYDYRYETIALLMHAEHLEAVSGVGPHTISIPRLLPAEGVDYSSFPHLVNDRDFKKIVAVIRLAVPYTGMILSTRESIELRNELLKIGVSQMSAGSSVGVGGYANRHIYEEGSHEEKPLPFDEDIIEEKPQFELADHRAPIDVVKSLVRDGYIPSYCTACYKLGRTGDRFMSLAKTGEIKNYCHPNALLTFEEYLRDYADEELKEMGQEMIDREIQNVPDEKRREKAISHLKRIREGESDLRF